MGDDAAIQGHEQILEQTIELIRSFPIPPGVELEMPPPSTRSLDIKFEEYAPAARSLRATVVVPERYANAVGLLQGGFLAAMFDDLIGPLSYLTAGGPTTTLDLTTQFMRPAFPGGRLSLSAEVRKPGRTAIFIAAEAHNEDGKLVATAVSTVQVISLPAS
jgi:uncharacterized protein (TIGR00369 family)